MGCGAGFQVLRHRCQITGRCAAAGTRRCCCWQDGVHQAEQTSLDERKRTRRQRYPTDCDL